MKVELKKNDAGLITDVVVRRSSEGHLVTERPLVYVPFLIVAFILCALFLRSVSLPARGFKGQLEILSSKNRARTHTWNCTITYIHRSVRSPAMRPHPIMIKTIYGGFDGAPIPCHTPSRPAHRRPGPYAHRRRIRQDRRQQRMHWTTLGQDRRLHGTGLRWIPYTHSLDQSRAFSGPCSGYS